MFYVLLYQHRLCQIPNELGTNIRWQQGLFIILVNIFPLILSIIVMAMFLTNANIFNKITENKDNEEKKNKENENN